MGWRYRDLLIAVLNDFFEVVGEANAIRRDLGRIQIAVAGLVDAQGAEEDRLPVGNLAARLADLPGRDVFQRREIDHVLSAAGVDVHDGNVVGADQGAARTLNPRLQVVRLALAQVHHFAKSLAVGS